MKKHTEIRFEDAAEHTLLQSGYEKGEPDVFDSKRALFPADVVKFLQDSQPIFWRQLQDFHGDAASESLLASLTKELDHKGALHVLRHGFRCFGKNVRLAYFQPNTNLNPDAWEDYKKNLVKVYRQVHFSERHPNLSLDMVLAISGVPVATVELKNPLTGQTVEHAKKQYKSDRDPRELIFQFKKRALVHFAVDPDWVYMTTKLAGSETHFLPFNQGVDFGAGNPPAEDSHRTAYLWEAVLQKDTLLDIIGRYLHLEVAEKKIYTAKGVKKGKKESLIFPRYHQLNAVQNLVARAKAHGSGSNYLVQHSAGSGKSNSIAWLAYRLASLHNDRDEKIFHSVVVITDRRVLDKQLQDTIYQFEHKQGMVLKIEKDTKQLAEALASGVPIIISTIQKFPFITEALQKLTQENKEIEIATKGKRFAVIVDEAHSSQSGEAATELKGILNKEGIEAVVAAQILDLEDEDLSEDAKEELLRQMAKRGKQPNLSFFAFTATPKFKTRAVFDQPGSNGKPPFHHYSMRQAIEEGFILDVLRHYTTYKTYYRLIKSVEDDPNVPRRKTARKLARFLKLHPHNIRQKVEVMIEHFRTHTKHKIGGRAKAMVVTDSRLHAVRYKQAMDAYIKEKKYTDLKTLVAFSGTVIDPELPTVQYTEVEMNQGIKESELPEKFESYEYQVLIVAEKYQTGFDQPLLHTMYVDKRLSGVQAVQTLSRLNRTAPGKVDTFVLDFVNDREEIFESFKPYYEVTLFDELTDPHLLYDLEHTLLEWKMFFKNDIDKFCDTWFSRITDLTGGDHRRINAILDPVVERFERFSEEEKLTFKKQLSEFRSLYNFLSQVIPYDDSELEKLYTFGRNLLTKLPKREESSGYELGEDVALKYYRLQKIAEGAINLRIGEPPSIYGAKEVGTGSVDERVPLSSLIETLNERFGTEFAVADQLFFDQVKKAALNKEELINAAKANTLENFKYVFDKRLENLFVERMEGNEEIFTRLMNDDEFRKVAAKVLARDVYKGILAREAVP